MRALFITGANQYGVVSHFLAEMRADLASIDVESDVLNVTDKETFITSAEQISPLDNYAFIVSFNRIGLDTRVQGYSVNDFAKNRKVFVLLVDHPLHLIQDFIGRNVTVLCVDREHVGFCQLCGIDAIYFPHAVAESHLSPGSFINLENKSDEIIYPVSYFNLESSRKTLELVWHQIGEELERSTSITRLLQAIGVLPLGNRAATVALDENIRRIAVRADFYIRAKSRLTFLEECYKKNIQLTVIGKSSEKYQTLLPFHRYEKEMPFHLLLERMRKAKFVAHNSPGFELGLHERVVIPLSVGTLPITSLTFLKQTFGDAAIGLDDAANITESQYTNYLNKGYQKVAKEHTWRSQWAPLIAKL